MQLFRKYTWGSIFFTLGVAAFFLWSIVFRLQARENILTVAFLDVGQGDAIFLQSPSGNQMLIDGGPNKKVLSELGDIMPFHDRSIDVVILTHPHEDHVGGLIDVLTRYDVGMIIESDAIADSGVYREWERVRTQEGAQIIPAVRGERIILDDGIWFDIVHPFENNVATDDPHARMIVGKLTYGNTCFIFTGDAERNIEFKLLNDDIDCEVLKVGHHGSKTSTSDAFLKAVSPLIAVISAGESNKYGHPHEVIMNKLKQIDVDIFGTFHEGRIILFSDGKSIWRK